MYPEITASSPLPNKAVQCTKSHCNLCALLGHMVDMKGERVKSKMAELREEWHQGLVCILYPHICRICFTRTNTEMRHHQKIMHLND